MLLRHMQAMEERIMLKFEAVDRRFVDMDAKFTLRFDDVDRQLMLLAAQIDNLDKRLDDIEVVQLPNIKKFIKMN